MLLHMNGKFTMGKLNHLSRRKVSFLTATHCQFGGIGEGMKQTYLYHLYLWYPYFKLNGLDAINEITKPRIIYIAERKIKGSG